MGCLLYLGRLCFLCTVMAVVAAVVGSMVSTRVREMAVAGIPAMAAAAEEVGDKLLMITVPIKKHRTSTRSKPYW